MNKSKLLKLLLNAVLASLTLCLFSCKAEQTPTETEAVSNTENPSTATEETLPEPEAMCVQLSASPGDDPLIVTDASCPDPFITYDNASGYYYGLSTQNSFIRLHRSKKLKDLFLGGENVIVYRAGSEILESMWAPEMAEFNGKWYIYSSGTVTSTDSTKHLFVLESETSDPFDGFHFKAYLNDNLFAIDPTIYKDEASGQNYICYSEVYNGQQVISMAVLNSPWEMGETNRICIPKTYKWEKLDRQNPAINEGPFFIKNGEKLFLVFSANGCYNDNYQLGYLEFTGDNLLDKGSWTKHDQPIFVQANGVYAPGHASFFYSPDGSELWIAYHCYYTPNKNNTRRFRVCQVQKVGFDENGLPYFGEPLARDTLINVPSGE